MKCQFISLRWPIYRINSVDKSKLFPFTSQWSSATVSLETNPLCLVGAFVYLFVCLFVCLNFVPCECFWANGTTEAYSLGCHLSMHCMNNYLSDIKFHLAIRSKKRVIIIADGYWNITTSVSDYWKGTKIWLNKDYPYEISRDNFSIPVKPWPLKNAVAQVEFKTITVRTLLIWATKSWWQQRMLESL